MKQVYLTIALFILGTSCGNNDQQIKVADVAVKPGKHNAEFNASYMRLLSAYFQLKDAFVKTDDTAVNKASVLLIAAIDSMKWGDLKNDTLSMKAIDVLTKSILSDASSISKDTDIEEKRKTFSTISENLYQLTKAVRFDQQVVYHQYCPMAFNDAGAYWLSNSTEVMNPYFGDKMLHCGEVTDSLGAH
jgi:hypothetical protein